MTGLPLPGRPAEHTPLSWDAGCQRLHGYQYSVVVASGTAGQPVALKGSCLRPHGVCTRRYLLNSARGSRVVDADEGPPPAAPAKWWTLTEAPRRPPLLSVSPAGPNPVRRQQDATDWGRFSVKASSKYMDYSRLNTSTYNTQFNPYDQQYTDY